MMFKPDCGSVNCTPLRLNIFFAKSILLTGASMPVAALIRRNSLHGYVRLYTSVASSGTKRAHVSLSTLLKT